MQAQSVIPPGLPRREPTVSYWQSPSDDIANTRTSSELPSDADVVIIGSGISGACVAFNLLNTEPGLRIVMLEARQAASGASGRNGGHTKHASYTTFPGNVENDGVDDAIKIAKLEYLSMVGIHDFIKNYNIDCDARRLATVDVYYDEKRLANARKSVELMQKLVGTDTPITDYTFCDPDEAASCFLTPNALAALKYEAGSLSAYKLTVGILKLGLSKGLNLQTNTIATQIRKLSPGESEKSRIWQVKTEGRGSIQASKVVLATNGYTAHLYPPLLGNIVPVRGVVTAQRPGSGMPQTGLPSTYTLVYENGFDYMITRPASAQHEGDIVIGGGITKARQSESDRGDVGTENGGLTELGNADDTTIDPAIESYLTQSTVQFFGESNWGQDHPDGRIRQIWSGIMGYSADGHPFVGPVPDEPGLFLDASFQGHGMVLCFLCADAVSKMILDQDGDDLDRWFPRCYRVTKERIAKRMESIPF